jgi:hypothetical protein
MKILAGLMINKIIFGAILVAVFSNPSLAQHQNFRVSKVESTNPEEVTIAINPANPRQLAAGANINFYYDSTDGGLTWTEGRLTSSLGVWGDPCVVFDAQVKRIVEIVTVNPFCHCLVLVSNSSM